MDEQAGGEPQSPHKNPIGPIVGIVIIVTLFVIGGVYFSTQRASAPAPERAPQEVLEAPDEALESLQAQGESDELGAIEEDLDGTELENLDAEFEQIESELGL